jgi:nitronate monooxygenase
MGAGISAWTLANAVARVGQLGVVAGTALDLILARRLQAGDPGGHMRRALAHFPLPGVAERLLERYFVAGGKAANARFRSSPVMTMEPSRHHQELLVAGNFVEVWLAREGHDNPVGINYLEKLQLPTLPSLFGAMLAGVGYVLMGAGIPKAIPGILDRLARAEPVELRIDVRDAAPDQVHFTRFDPNEFWGGPAPHLGRPQFLAIIASAQLAKMMAKKASGEVNGFIIEGPTAGGHNAPPRGGTTLGATGEPIYGERDIVDLPAVAELGKPFWLAGSFGAPGKLGEALALGAAGVQVGTAFAYSEESGLAPALKSRILQMSQRGEAHVFTDAVASPTGFPFKVVQLDGTISEKATYEERSRICDLGYLRHAYTRDDGRLGWRCPSEPVKDYLRKGGSLEDTVGRKCVCNGLMTNLDLGQVQQSGYHELPFVTSGDDVATVARFLAPGAGSYSAASVIERLLAPVHGDDACAPAAVAPYADRA